VNCDLAVRINSGDDGATWSKNLVNVCPVTPEITVLQVYKFLDHLFILFYFTCESGLTALIMILISTVILLHFHVEFAIKLLI